MGEATGWTSSLMCRASERSPSRRFSRPSTGWCALASEPQVNYAFSKDMSKAEILRCLKGEHQEMVKAIKPFKENVEWEDYKE